jgi:hypothetical protein
VIDEHIDIRRIGRKGLEDKIRPAHGGADCAENLRILCRPSNQRAAIEALGLPGGLNKLVAFKFGDECHETVIS